LLANKRDALPAVKRGWGNSGTACSITRAQARYSYKAMTDGEENDEERGKTSGLIFGSNVTNQGPN